MAFADYIPKWSALRQIGNSTIAKATIILPVIGYAVIFNDELMQKIHLYAPLASDHAWWMISSKKRLFLLYLGGSLFASATILFQIRCPDLIKRFASEHGFYLEELRIITISRIEEIREEVRRYVNIERSKYKDNIIRDLVIESDDALGSSRSVLINEEFASENRDTIRDIVVSSYSALNNSRTIARAIISLIYLVATILTAIPSIEFTVRVIIEALKSAP